MAVEEAKYTVLKQQDEFEIRQYAPSIVAEVVVEGEFTKASNRAFRKLFKFISGDNTRQSKIAMTAPVSQTAGSEKIAMTAPVGQQASPGGWIVSFMMPASYTLVHASKRDTNPYREFLNIFSEGHKFVQTRTEQGGPKFSSSHAILTHWKMRTSVLRNIPPAWWVTKSPFRKITLFSPVESSISLNGIARNLVLIRHGLDKLGQTQRLESELADLIQHRNRGMIKIFLIAQAVFIVKCSCELAQPDKIVI